VFKHNGNALYEKNIFLYGLPVAVYNMKHT
jgi:hypothetical protein